MSDILTDRFRSNARFALLLLSLSVLLGFSRQLGVYVFELLPEWGANLLTTGGMVLAVTSVVLAWSAFRSGERAQDAGPEQRPGPPSGR